jgi:NADH:ubiquinone oxidoreductase subunit E
VDEAWGELEPELRRAAMVMMDFDEITHEYGMHSPQATMVREVYAMATLDAALVNLRVPPFEPLAHVKQVRVCQTTWCHSKTSSTMSTTVLYST